MNTAMKKKIGLGEEKSRIYFYNLCGRDLTEKGYIWDKEAV